MADRSVVLRNLVSRDVIVALAVLVLAFTALLAMTRDSNGSVSENFFSGLLSVLAIAVGFISAFYLFVRPGSGQLLPAIKKTKSFGELVDLMRHGIKTTLIGVLLAFWCSNLALTVPEANPLEWGPPDILVVITLIVSAYSFATIYRCGRLFEIVAK